MLIYTVLIKRCRNNLCFIKHTSILTWAYFANLCFIEITSLVYSVGIFPYLIVLNCMISEMLMFTLHLVLALQDF
jgi:hypothetical protein